MLETTLAEEREADTTLSHLAETINLAARSAGGPTARPKDGSRSGAKSAASASKAATKTAGTKKR